MPTLVDDDSDEEQFMKHMHDETPKVSINTENRLSDEPTKFSSCDVFAMDTESDVKWKLSELSFAMGRTASAASYHTGSDRSNKK
jgi:hypothetical protein